MRGILFLILFLSARLSLAESFLVYEENGKMGIKNEQGKVVVPASFEALGWSDGSFSVINGVTGYRANNQWGILNLKKEFVTKAEYETLFHTSGEYFIVSKKINPTQIKIGCLNIKGEVKIPFQYDGISIHGLRAIVFNLHLGHYSYGLIDLQNNILVPLQYNKIIALGTLRFAAENKAGKFALFNDAGKPVTEFKIDSISAYKSGYATLYQNLDQGLLDQDGKIVIESKFQQIKITDAEKAAALPHHEWFILNEKNEVQLRVQADELLPVSEDAIIYGYSNKYGLLGPNMNIILPAQYDQLKPLRNGLFTAKKKGKSGVIHPDNSIGIPIMYDSLFVEGNSFRVFNKSNGWILVDNENKVKTQKQFDWIGSKQADLYPVTNFGYWGALNNSGTEIIHCVFDSLIQISENQLVVKFKNQYGIISNKEEWLVSPQNFPLRLVNDSCYLQVQPQNIFLTKFSGEVIYFTDNRVEFLSSFWKEYLPDGTIKLVDYHGRLIKRIDPPVLDKLEEVYAEHEGMRGIKRDNKYGFVDARNRLRIANRYDGIGDFHEGLAAIKLLGKWGFLNQQDQIVINPQFESVESFSNGLCIVRRNKKAGVIQKSGKYILNAQYDSIKSQVNKKLKLYNANLIGLADEYGNILIEPRFDFLQDLENGYLIVGRDKKYGVISMHGLSAIPLIYDTLTYDVSRNQYLALKKAEWKDFNLDK